MEELSGFKYGLQESLLLKKINEIVDWINKEENKR